MGANQLVSYCGQLGEAQKQFKAIISFNNPWDLYSSANLMKKSPYEQFMVRGIKDAYFLRLTDSWTFKGKPRDDRENKKKKPELAWYLSKIGLSQREKEIFKQISEKYNIALENIVKSTIFDEFDVHFTNKSLVQSPF
mmetsp:Transcript_15071/g.25594  ORF Transcript_15071/g.25594 Transcript_15071/m.25594 type:complete len:138 (-) Transcript_15071:490-903(-)